MLRDVREGLSTRPRQLPPKYFYDERGSELFDEITRLPEYYPTRAERSLLRRHAAAIIGLARPATLVELGAGSSDKTRLLLDEMVRSAQRGGTYIPVDVSADFLKDSVVRLRDEYPSLRIDSLVADFSVDFSLPEHPLPALHALLGSTIGNFTPDAAVAVVSKVRKRMLDGDSFLLGVDLRKDPEVIRRAYDDSQGVTAAFNRNMLSVLNHCLGANFNADMFDHRAIYTTAEHRIEMQLVSRADQRVYIPDIGDTDFVAGEYIITELSYKYDRDAASTLLNRSGLRLREWFTDDAATFALLLASG